MSSVSRSQYLLRQQRASTTRAFAALLALCIYTRQALFSGHSFRVRGARALVVKLEIKTSISTPLCGRFSVSHSMPVRTESIPCCFERIQLQPWYAADQKLRPDVYVVVPWAWWLSQQWGPVLGHARLHTVHVRLWRNFSSFWGSWSSSRRAEEKAISWPFVCVCLAVEAHKTWAHHQIGMDWTQTNICIYIIHLLLSHPRAIFSPRYFCSTGSSEALPLMLCFSIIRFNSLALIVVVAVHVFRLDLFNFG